MAEVLSMCTLVCVRTCESIYIELVWSCWFIIVSQGCTRTNCLTLEDQANGAFWKKEMRCVMNAWIPAAGAVSGLEHVNILDACGAERVP